ncbi:leucine-rich repeat-containing protein 75B [Leptonychotes weddellii]|uniref:Leucine-rich repeat-containing protein 75B n=1 Tax=Leptonychotes weddellii TaxID=9713 RepID=A0A7F8PUQ6_LEPWE|nr:leucine-rich repeat-containing protein 75B [Leptonychotes weddellii]
MAKRHLVRPWLSVSPNGSRPWRQSSRARSSAGRGLYQRDLPNRVGREVLRSWPGAREAGLAPDGRAGRQGSEGRDLGLEGTLLTDILYRNVAFLNLVDPISHDLLVNLARDLQCPKTDYELWKSSDKICRQLIYHLTPHSKRQRGSSLPRRKTQSCLKSSLQMTQLAGETVNLSGILLSTRDVRHIMRYLGSQGAGLTVLDLSFTGLSDELLRLMLPSLWTLPHLTQLLLNGNRLTRATARELTEAVKDSAKFPALAWVDLGNNVDVTSLPQPLLVGLRRRLSQRTSLPTIYEGLDLEPEGGVAGATSAASTWGSAAAGPGSEPQACCTR